jgi:lipopolysaccharide export system permease protein
MKVVTALIVREIIKGSLIAMLLLLTLFNLFTLADELGDVGKGYYGLKEVFYYLALTTPRVFYELMPAAALLGSLFVLGAMANHGELIAMQAAGFSVLRIILAVLMAGTFLVVIAIGVGEFVAPLTEKKAQLLKVTTQKGDAQLTSRHGIWLREGKQFINVRQLLPDNNLTDISIFELDENRRLKRAVHAEHAVFLGDHTWRLEKISASIITPTAVTTDSWEQQQWQSSIAPDLLKITVVNPDNLSLVDLSTYIAFLKNNLQKSQMFELAFWGRLVNPLVTYVMLLLAAPFVIGIKRGISSGARLMIGVIIGMGFNIVDRIVSHMGLIYDYNPLLVSIAPSLVVLIGAFLVSAKVREH